MGGKEQSGILSQAETQEAETTAVNRMETSPLNTELTLCIS